MKEKNRWNGKRANHKIKEKSKPSRSRDVSFQWPLLCSMDQEPGPSTCMWKVVAANVVFLELFIFWPKLGTFAPATHTQKSHQQKSTLPNVQSQNFLSICFTKKKEKGQQGAYGSARNLVIEREMRRIFQKPFIIWFCHILHGLFFVVAD